MKTYLSPISDLKNPAGNMAYSWLLPPYAADPPVDFENETAKKIHESLRHYRDEAIYVFCLQKRQLIYASGFQDILGFSDNEVTMRMIQGMTISQHASFMHDVQLKALQFINGGYPQLEQYVFIIELKKRHKLGHEVPLETRMSVYESQEGVAKSIIGRLQLAPHLRFDQVVRYSVCGPDENLLEDALSRTQFLLPAISAKEHEALKLVAQGCAFKEVAHQLGISHSAVEKRILPLYKRFEVRSLTHLVSYAYEHGILP